MAITNRARRMSEYDEMVAALAATYLRTHLAPGAGHRHDAIRLAIVALNVPSPGTARWRRINSTVIRLLKG